METATTRFIKDAIAGGWRPKTPADVRDFESFSKESALLDPNAWQAVGKTRGWRVVGNTKHDNEHHPDSYYKMQEFMTLLHDGKDINTALEGIE